MPFAACFVVTLVLWLQLPENAHFVRRDVVVVVEGDAILAIDQEGLGEQVEVGEEGLDEDVQRVALTGTQAEILIGWVHLLRVQSGPSPAVPAGDRALSRGQAARPSPAWPEAAGLGTFVLRSLVRMPAITQAPSMVPSSVSAAADLKISTALQSHKCSRFYPLRRARNR